MSKTFRSYDPEQQLLLPAALQEWLPPDHLAYFISDVVDQLDLSAITSLYEREERGGPPYHPRMMVKVLLYGYCTGVDLPGASPGACARTSPSGYWRPTTTRTSARSPIFARTTWQRWPTCSGRCWPCASGRDW